MLNPESRREHDRFGGNGGLSLRRVSAIRRVLTFQVRYNDTEPDDEWFGKRLRVLPGERVATGDEGVLAVEDVYYEKPMGFHVRGGGEKLKEEVWKNPERRKAIFEYCPELSLIMDMKLERERCDDDNGEGGLGPTDAEKVRFPLVLFGGMLTPSRRKRKRRRKMKRRRKTERRKKMKRRGEMKRRRAMKRERRRKMKRRRGKTRVIPENKPYNKART